MAVAARQPAASSVLNFIEYLGCIGLVVFVFSGGVAGAFGGGGFGQGVAGKTAGAVRSWRCGAGSVSLSEAVLARSGGCEKNAFAKVSQSL